MINLNSFSVTVAANITEYPSSQVVTSPSTATFTCIASGLPRPTITWTDPDNCSLTSGVKNISITNINVGDRLLQSTLHVMMTTPSVSGMYICNAYNGILGRRDITTANTILMVYGKEHTYNNENKNFVSY